MADHGLQTRASALNKGIQVAKKSNEIGVKEQKKRAIAKAFTWRVIGSLDTMLIAYLLMTFFGQANDSDLCKDSGSNAQIAFYIGIVEVLSKSFLYYFHERMWSRLSFGIPKKEDYSI